MAAANAVTNGQQLKVDIMDELSGGFGPNAAPATCAPAAVNSDIKALREALAYDPDTGELTWRAGRRGRRGAGGRAGAFDPRGYVIVTLDGRKLYGHRLAWVLYHGEDPGKLHIDHVNGDRSDNRAVNLRLATRSQNGSARNRPPRTSTSGFIGVSPTPKGRFRAYVKDKGRFVALGAFDDPREAALARDKAALRVFGDFASTNVSFGLVEPDEAYLEAVLWYVEPGQWARLSGGHLPRGFRRQALAEKESGAAHGDAAKANSITTHSTDAGAKQPAQSLNDSR
jgi:hypothetical protein